MNIWNGISGKPHWFFTHEISGLLFGWPTLHEPLYPRNRNRAEVPRWQSHVSPPGRQEADVGHNLC